jgi:uncharacterized protein (TIGR00369 family)
MTFQARDPDFEQRVRSSFAQQAAMRTFGATLEHLAPGEVHVAMPFRADFTQQHGFLHAGVITAIVDSACGYAALSLMEPGAAVLSVEFKVQLLAPARGILFRARGRVVRAGRTLSVVAGEVHAYAKENERENGKLVALLNGTMMSVLDRAGLRD